MENKDSSLYYQNIDQLHQQVSGNKTLFKQAQKLKIMFIYLLLGYSFWGLLFVLYFQNIDELPKIFWWTQLFWLFLLAIWGIIKFHRGYNRKKKVFSEAYKAFAIPKILKIFHLEYLYVIKAEYENEKYELDISYPSPINEFNSPKKDIDSDKKLEKPKENKNFHLKNEQQESINQMPWWALKPIDPSTKKDIKGAKKEHIETIERKIKSDIEKMIDIWLWNWGNRGLKPYWIILFFPFFGVFFLYWLVFRLISKKKVDFEDFFGLEKDKVKFTAIEIQNYPLSINKITSGSKFLTKFSYTSMKYKLQNKKRFFVKLTGLPTKRKIFQFNMKKIWYYVFIFVFLILPFFELLYRLVFDYDSLDIFAWFIFMSRFVGFLIISALIFAYNKKHWIKLKQKKQLTDIQKWNVLFSQDFLDYYDIQTNDQVLANQFLDPAMKEKLMLLHQQYRGTYDFYFEGNDFYCIKYLSKGKHFLDTFSHWNWDKNHTLQVLYLQIKELDWLFSIVDIH